MMRARLERALLALYVDHRAAPYRIPAQIDHDLWRFVRTDSADEARGIIAQAVAGADGINIALRDALTPHLTASERAAIARARAGKVTVQA